MLLHLYGIAVTYYRVVQSAHVIDGQYLGTFCARVAMHFNGPIHQIFVVLSMLGVELMWILRAFSPAYLFSDVAVP